ncbi:MAG: hypothetical protein GXP35_16240 [Actinobacteria bacterium]|nr:hypothetical protein [Actinomycetota bacterium]
MQAGLIRALEWMVGLSIGLIVGYFAVWLPPGLMWPGVTGTIALIVGGKMIFEGVFPGFGYGLSVSTAVSLGYFVYFFMLGVD